MDSKEFSRYHRWCSDHGIKVYPVTEYEVEKSKLNITLKLEEITNDEFKKRNDILFKKFVTTASPTLFIAKESDGKIAFGNMQFINNVNADGFTISQQIGILLKAICYKELNLMEIKSTYNQLEGICASAFKKDIPGILLLLSSGVPFREAVLYMEGFYPDKKESAELILKLAHCKCGQMINFKPKKTNTTLCDNCSLQKSFSQIEYKAVTNQKI